MIYAFQLNTNLSIQTGIQKFIQIINNVLYNFFPVSKQDKHLDPNFLILILLKPDGVNL